MFRHIIKIAIRSFIRNRSFAFINMFGLSFGLATFILIALYVQYEYSWDKFHANSNRIYRVQPIAHMANGDQYWSQIGFPIGEEMRAKFPEFENKVVTRPVWGEYLSTSEEKTYYEEEGQFVEPSFFDIFSAEFLEGSPDGALEEPYSIVLNEELRAKYFGDQPALGKYVTAGNRYELKVTGVVKKYPGNSIFQFDYLAPIELIEINEDRALSDQWDNFSYFAFMLVHENADFGNLNMKIRDFLMDHDHFKDNPTKYSLYLNPLTDIHFLADPNQKGLLIIVYLYAGIAIFALLIACVNFMNLTTAYSVTRAREIGIKKVVGSNRGALARQFLFESIFLALVSMHLAFVLAEFAMPYFNGIVSRTLDIRYIDNWEFIVFIIVITLFTGILAGTYPAFVLSRFKPGQVLKSASSMANTKSPLRKVLVTFQFVISSILILLTIVVYKQIDFMKNKDLGFSRDQVIHAYISAETREEGKSRDLDILESQLRQIPGIQSVALSQTIPFYGSQGTNVTWEGAQPDQTVNSRYNFVTYDFFKTFDIDFTTGRNFSRDMGTDPEEAVIINETAVRTFGWDDPLEKKVNFWGKDYRVIGVVSDFHPFTVFEKIPPFVFRLHSGNIDQGSRHAIRFAEQASVGEIREKVTQIYQSVFPTTLFDFGYYGDKVNDGAMEVYEGVLGTFMFFSIITIAIAAVGMFGLVAFTTKSRTKEIGIRKVHGASSGEIFGLLAREFILLIIIAVALSFPAAFGFRSIDPSAYKPAVEVWEFLFTGILVMVITFSTITLHTRKASRQNPSNALRYE